MADDVLETDSAPPAQPPAAATAAAPEPGKKRRPRMGDLLVERGIITRAQLEECLTLQKSSPSERMGQILIRKGYAKEEDVMVCLAQEYGLEYVRLTQREVPARVLGMLPPDFCRRHKVLVIDADPDNKTATVATPDPANVFLVDEIKRRLGCRVRLAVTTTAEVTKASDELLGTSEEFQLDDLIRDIADDAVEIVAADEDEVPDLAKVSGESPVVRLANYLICNAVKEGASDIHIEPGEKKMRVRYRIDGVLFEVMSPPQHMHPALVSRLKIMSNLDISERRLPQDGRIRLRFSGRQIDMRVSTVPTLFGEGVVIRLLDKSIGLMALEDLGMPPGSLAQFSSVIRKPHGIILVTGPTGSGKTTTLYAGLSRIISPERKVITIEDPVEYQLPGAIQINVRPNIGLSFASGLRHIVRQDPDIIMVGEIRDRETADIAIHAALTGHLVFSTLHTNDSAGAVTRLLDMGIEPYLVASSLIAVLAQRLVRVICPDCRQPTTLEDEALAELGVETEARSSVAAWRGQGCDRCRSTGYLGRVGVFELLPINDEVRSQVLEKAAASHIKQGAVARGMQTLLADGRDKVSQGRTTVEEVLHVCQRDEL